MAYTRLAQVQAREVHCERMFHKSESMLYNPGSNNTVAATVVINVN